MPDNATSQLRIVNVLRKKEAELVVDLSKLQAAVIQTQHELDVVRSDLRDLDVDGQVNDSLRPVARATEPTRAATTSAPKDPNNTRENLSIFKGLTLIDAIAKYLEISGEDLQAATKIWEALRRAGFPITSTNPRRAISQALRERANKKGDVFCAGSKWGFRDNFTEQKVTNLQKRYAGMGGRSPDEHGVKTSKGMRAAIASGRQIGRKRVFTEAMARELRQLLDDDWTMKRACRKLGISAQCAYTYGFPGWKVGDPLQRKLKPEEIARQELRQGRPQLRVVENRTFDLPSQLELDNEAASLGARPLSDPGAS